MRRLADAGLTTREACGNSVRNITACHVRRRLGRRGVRRHAVCRGADALLPASSAQLVAAAQVQDRLRGLPRRSREDRDQRHRLARARRADGRRGFRVLVGGGTAIMCTAGRRRSSSSCRSASMLDVAEAIVRVFHRLGDYQHKQRNRMKFLIKALGWEKWQEEFDAAFAEVTRGRRHRAAVRSPSRRPKKRRPSWPRQAPPSVDAVARACSRRELRGPGIRP